MLGMYVFGGGCVRIISIDVRKCGVAQPVSLLSSQFPSEHLHLQPLSSYFLPLFCCFQRLIVNVPSIIWCSDRGNYPLLHPLQVRHSFEMVHEVSALISKLSGGHYFVLVAARFHRRRKRVYFTKTHIKSHRRNRGKSARYHLKALAVPTQYEVVYSDFRGSGSKPQTKTPFRIVSWNIEMGLLSCLNP